MATVTIWEFLADVDPLAILETAKWMLETSGDDCPDWIRILAGGNLAAFPSVLDEARRAYEAEQEEE